MTTVSHEVLARLGASDRIREMVENDLGGSDVLVEAVAIATGLEPETNFGVYPASVVETRDITLGILSTLYRTIGDADSGGSHDVAWSAPYARIVQLEKAYADLGAAIEQLKADAGEIR